MDGIIYEGAEDGSFYAIYPDGTLEWKISLPPCQPEDFFFSAPAIGPDPLNRGLFAYDICLEDTCGNVTALSQGGTADWTFVPSVSSHLNQPMAAIGADGTVYGLISSPDNGGLFELTRSSSVKWVSSINPVAAIAADGTAYFWATPKPPFGSYLYAIRPDGTLKWQVSTGEPNGLENAIAIGGDGTIYLGAGGLRAFDPSNGTVKWVVGPQTSFGKPAIGEMARSSMQSMTSLILSRLKSFISCMREVLMTVTMMITSGVGPSAAPTAQEDGTIHY